jgi:hypothetical protein
MKEVTRNALLVIFMKPWNGPRSHHFPSRQKKILDLLPVSGIMTCTLLSLSYAPDWLTMNQRNRNVKTKICPSCFSRYEHLHCFVQVHFKISINICINPKEDSLSFFMVDLIIAFQTSLRGISDWHLFVIRGFQERSSQMANPLGHY